jgi:hypothetical protein
MENKLTQDQVVERSGSWFTSAEICEIYGVSEQTLKNWRRGSYFRGTKKILFLEDGTFLNHLPPDPGKSILYQIRDVNKWLRKIGREETIPDYLSNL